MNSAKSVAIQPIDKTTVNQICSGQVVLNLATAVKELLENSIDAGSTSIQIMLKEYGSELIEVSDNGCGVEEANFQALTLKHHTSKISDFSDVYSVETFGFRGEALSSLCSLSDVSITTRHKSVLVGTKLQMDHNGIITSQTKVARQVGTTVTLKNIFSTLPVRHKEFLRNIKKEFTKMCGVIYAYGLQACGIGISCMNSTSGKKVPVMDTRGESVKSNIACIFGTKQAQNLLEIKEIWPSDEILDEYNLKPENLNDEHVKMYRLGGYISSCAHGSGRSSADRQFYYINSRPVDNVKLTKLVNDVYHQNNPHQYPFVVLNIKVSLDSVDVNVTPDKRQIFLDNEKLLLAVLKSSLVDLYKNIPSTLNVQNVGLIKPVAAESNGGQGIADKFKQFRSKYSSDSSNVKESRKNCERNDKFSQKRLESFLKPDLSHEKSLDCRNEEKSQTLHEEAINSEDFVPRQKAMQVSALEKPSADEIELKKHSDQLEAELKEDYEPSKDFEKADDIVLNGKFQAVEKLNSANKRKCESDCFSEKADGNSVSESEPKKIKIDTGITETDKSYRKTIIYNCSLNKIQQKLTDSKKCRNSLAEETDIKFFAEINPAKNESAEKELKKELSKDRFKEMEIIGQFNLGFVITKLGPDLFIIDQHATDEKYNFETLQLNTVIQSQKLVIPQKLELTVEKEGLFLEHSDVIRKNGFDFSFEENEVPTRRLKLTSIPLSKNWVFGKSDIDELLFMLEDAPDAKMCRPSRVRDMFASRACRKSVMIGTALNRGEMRRLIDHMGEIEHPWNCPHGRPTIRHLLNLNMIQHEES